MVKTIIRIQIINELKPKNPDIMLISINPTSKKNNEIQSIWLYTNIPNDKNSGVINNSNPIIFHIFTLTLNPHTP